MLSCEQDSRESEETENIILEEKNTEDDCYSFEVMVFLFFNLALQVVANGGHTVNHQSHAH